MARAKIDEIIQSILSGIKKAESDYLGWSGENPYRSWPEYMITTYIARSICTRFKNEFWVSMEYDVKDALYEANYPNRGRPSRKLRLNGKYDLVIWWKNGFPRCIGEVKHHVVWLWQG